MTGIPMRAMPALPCWKRNTRTFTTALCRIRHGGVSHQKLAATIGIKASKYDWLVFTRPDSAPQSNQWLRKLARNFTPSTQIVLGYHRYNSGENRLQRKAVLYGLFYAMRYLGFALAGRPYMGNGHNLAYRKELFYKHKGFSAHLDIPQGDDGPVYQPGCHTGQYPGRDRPRDAIMNIPETLTRKHWHDEQAGYAATARHYRGLQRYCNGMETTTRLLFYIAWAATCILSLLCQHWLAAGIALMSFALRFTMQASVINRTARNLGEPGKYYLSLPLFDFNATPAIVVLETAEPLAKIKRNSPKQPPDTVI